MRQAATSLWEVAVAHKAGRLIAMFRLAYLSLVGAVVSTPVHLLTNTEQTRWAIFALIAAAVAFLTAGMMRRP